MLMRVLLPCICYKELLVVDLCGNEMNETCYFVTIAF